MFKLNAYSNSQIQHAFRGASAVRSQVYLADSKIKRTILPFCGDTSFKIGRLLLKVRVHPIFRSIGKLITWLPPIKDSFGLRIPGFYTTPCVCGQVYIGPTGRTIIERLGERQRYMRLRQKKKSGFAEQCVTLGHVPVFDQPAVLSSQELYWNRLVEEAIYFYLFRTQGCD